MFSAITFCFDNTTGSVFQHSEIHLAVFAVCMQFNISWQLKDSVCAAFTFNTVPVLMNINTTYIIAQYHEILQFSHSLFQYH